VDILKELKKNQKQIPKNKKNSKKPRSDMWYATGLTRVYLKKI